MINAPMDAMYLATLLASLGARGKCSSLRPAFRSQEQPQAVPRVRRRITESLEVFQRPPFGLCLYCFGPGCEPIPSVLVQGTGNNQKE